MQIFKTLVLFLVVQMATAQGIVGNSSDFLVEGRHTVDPDGSIVMGWPGNAVEGRFTGSALRVYLQDGLADYNVEIDGMTYPVLRTAKGQVEYELTDGLDDGEHRFRLSRRIEGGSSKSLGVQLSGDGQLLAPPPAPTAKIEFLGDSYTVGYGLEAGFVRCGQSKVRETTNHDLAFPSLVSRHFGAQHHTVAVSGTGLVRNYGGKDNRRNYPFYFGRSVTGRSQPSWDLTQWKPQIVVIGLGINDFSTPLKSSEGFVDYTDFVVRWKQSYHDLMDQLRQNYGGVTFVLAAVPFARGEQLRFVEEVVQEQRAAGYTQVYFAPLPRPIGDGCQAHPGYQDHQKFAETLINLMEENHIWKLGQEAYLGPVKTGLVYASGSFSPLGKH